MLGILLLQALAQTVPADWSLLAPMPYAAPPQMTPPLVRFVADEVAAGRCPVPRPADGHYIMRVDVAALVRADGSIRRTIPRAIQCPTIEQYSAGLVVRFARGNLPPRVSAPDQWYRATVVYEWDG